MFEQLDQLTEPLQGMLGSPWLWLVILLVSGLDALLPFMPSETTVVLVAVLIGPDLPLLALLAGVAAAGALAGDCLGYAVGRYAGPRAVARLLRGERGRARHSRARARVERHAALLIIAGRFLPGGRVIAALSTGSVRFPLRRFVALDAVGAGIWAVGSAALGGLGGTALTDSPAEGMLLASGTGLVVAGCVGALHRRSAPRDGERPAPKRCGPRIRAL
ncbi:membrane protein DedA, SNARE-associated domain [Streptomyces sp. 2224.1]|uniref:VTT domain-containing protein n=1 Tax=Streptomyces mooreae TaxID=3075523 RepID=A0ABU2THM7_9ACTN|nr:MULTISPECIES: VTT domain-containing protein [unclassified Streptomyces]MDT0460446.1 VTT domain-containing protein [Streptomyces sp. DSM 41527]PBC82029.1 membrane protein DedA with SNARE-associated domain [Streptomyces sp. 2321.6]SDR51850.1 membrane protein DedA, SNARE-associated domain [Streptomyces sp. KS_16]SEC40649.1 membrane protein DedA, SNARE-associated domain [Streptomyces sp. 2133.1]SEC62931.1 membrane protein DedA, SNARE-associated domain [Streptomyces sp. 2224.1]